MDIIIKISAEKDIHEIYNWYEKQLSGLGERFLEDFQQTILISKLIRNLSGLSTKISERFRFQNFHTWFILEFKNNPLLFKK
jgi:hypothetical protein